MGNIFLNNLLMSGVDLPANFLGGVGNQTKGRRFTTGVALLIGGIANFGCIPLLLLDGQLAKRVLYHSYNELY